MFSDLAQGTPACQELLVQPVDFIRCWVTCGSNLIVLLRASVISFFPFGSCQLICSPLRERERTLRTLQVFPHFCTDSSSALRQRLMIPRRSVPFPTCDKSWRPCCHAMVATLAMLRNTRQCFGITLDYIVGGGMLCASAELLVFSTHVRAKEPQ